MKVTIAYIPQEEAQARAVERCVKLLHPGVKVRRSDKHEPYRHIRLTVKPPCKADNAMVQ